MGMDAAVRPELGTIIDAALRGGLTEDQATRAVALGAEAARAATLAASAHIAAQAHRLAALGAGVATGPRPTGTTTSPNA